MTANSQPGIVARPREHLLVAALTFTASAPPGAQQSLVQLRSVIERELASDIDEITAQTPRSTPFVEPGELGVTDGYDSAGLIITVGISASGFAALGVAGDQVPQDLAEVPWGLFHDSPAVATNGDVVLHVTSDSAYVVEHVLRRVEVALAGQFSVAWTLVGEQRYGANAHAAPNADTPRALIGFHDGLSNLDASKLEEEALIFVDPAAVAQYPATPPPGPQPAPSQGQPGYGPNAPSMPTGLRNPPSSEPAWTAGGSYMFVRGSVLNMSTWDQTALGQQEQAVGRFKSSGATLDNLDETAHRLDPPQFPSNPAAVAVPPNSHLRRANPRSQASDALRRILRRGYPLISGNGAGTLQRGLLFVSFSRSLSTQVEFILGAWLKNPDFPTGGSGTDPLLAFETGVLAGGYFFVPPLADPRTPAVSPVDHSAVNLGHLAPGPL
jgi:deferrochelatase/peroxidase EfeB